MLVNTYLPSYIVNCNSCINELNQAVWMDFISTEKGGTFLEATMHKSPDESAMDKEESKRSLKSSFSSSESWLDASVLH